MKREPLRLRLMFEILGLFFRSILWLRAFCEDIGLQVWIPTAREIAPLCRMFEARYRELETSHEGCAARASQLRHMAVSLDAMLAGVKVYDWVDGSKARQALSDGEVIDLEELPRSA